MDPSADHPPCAVHSTTSTPSTSPFEHECTTLHRQPQRRRKINDPAPHGDEITDGNSITATTTAPDGDGNEDGVRCEREVLMQTLHERNQKGWRWLALNFTPSWFAATMGTGIVSILIYNLPWESKVKTAFSVVMFCLNIVLFILFTLISTIRYMYFPGLFKAMIKHPVQSLFLGTIPMGLATIINMIVFVCVPQWGNSAVTAAWCLWWIDIVMAASTCMLLPYIIMSVHDHENLLSMTATWLLPIVATVVASATGSLIAAVLPNQQHALLTLVVSYVLWGMGVPMAMLLLVIYFHRLTVHKLPPREVIVSVFLPLGPLGQGGFAIMNLGKVAMDLFPKTNSLIPEAGPILYVFGFLTALVMWGFGLVWLFFAIASVSRTKFPFNMGWWGFTFPIGVFAVSTSTLGKELPSSFFKIAGIILSFSVVLLWAVVSILTIHGAFVTKKLLFAPCAAEYETAFLQKEAEKQEKKARPS